MSVVMTVQSQSDMSPEDVFEQEATLTGSVTLMVAVFAACIGYYAYLVAPAFVKYTQSVEFANGVFVYGMFVLAIGVAFIAQAIAVLPLCTPDQD